MTNELDTQQQAANPAVGDTTPDRVGYRNPPKHSQFRPGQSGNPSGRPKGRRSFKADLAAALDAPMPGTAHKTLQQTIIENLATAAAVAGNVLAVKLLIPLALSLDDSKGDGEGELTEQQQKLIADFNRRQESAELTNTADGGNHEPAL